MKVTEVIYARGHENIKATHKTTMEITKDPYLTPRGDCIIAVKANKAALDLSRRLIEKLKNPKSVVKITLTAMLLE